MSANLSERDAEKNKIINEITSALNEAFPRVRFIINKTEEKEFAKISWKDGPPLDSVKKVVDKEFGSFVTFNRIFDEQSALDILDDIYDEYGTGVLYQLEYVTVKSDDGTKKITGCSFISGYHNAENDKLMFDNIEFG